MLAQKPLSSFTTGDIPQTTATYPGLAHYFPCNEVTGETTVTDTVGGVVFTPDAAVTNNGDGYIVPTTASAASLTSGSWAAPGTKNVLFVCIGAHQFAGQMTIGDTAGANGTYELVKGANPVAMDDEATQHTLTAVTGYGANDAGRCMYVSTTNSAVGIHKIDSSGAYSKVESIAFSAGAPSAYVGSIQTISSTIHCNLGTAGIIYVLHTTADLSDQLIEEAFIWAYDDIVNGSQTKIIYPGLKDIE